MKMCGSEFARMAGVSAMAVSKLCKSGKLVREGWLLDTDNPVNARYLAKHGVLFDVATAEDVNVGVMEEDAGVCLSCGARDVLKGLAMAARYIINAERKRAEEAGKVDRKIDPGTEHFLRYLVKKLKLENVDNEFMHDNILLTMAPQYRLAYLKALADMRKSEKIDTAI